METTGAKPTDDTIEEMGPVFGVETFPVSEWEPFNLDCWMRIYSDAGRVHFTHRIVTDLGDQWAEYIVALDTPWDKLNQSVKEYYRERVVEKFTEMKERKYGIERS